MAHPGAATTSEAVEEGSAEAARGRYEGKRRRILDAATILLNERGVRGMTFQEVAQALALKTTSIVYYFRYKELLAAAVFEDSLDRLAAIARDAGTAATPRARVARYLDLYFAQSAAALRGEARPLAILSEIRALEDKHRAPLIARYQAIFREVRAFFGPCDEPARRHLLTARTQLLNEALFWSGTWLKHYALGDFTNVRLRMFDILEHGIATHRATWAALPVASDEARPQPTHPPFLRVATRLINEFGYKSASVDRIMRELNLTKGSFYHHMEAKDDLILECFRDTYRRLAEIQRLADGLGGTRWERLLSAIASVLKLQFAGDHPMLRSTALQAMPPALRDRALILSDREALWLAGLLVDGMKDGSVRIIDPLIGGHIIISTINSAFDVRGWAARQPIDTAVSRYAGLLTDGLFD